MPMAIESMRRLSGLAAALILGGCGDADIEPGGSNTSTPAPVETSSDGEPGDGTPTDDTTAASSGGVATSGSGSTAADSADASGEGTFGMPAEPMPCPADIEPTALEIGHGSGQFTALASGPAPLVHGRQGGFHIVLGVRAPGLDTSGPGTAHLRGTVDGQVLADHPFVANLICEDEAIGAQALWINLVLESTPAQLHGKTVEIDVEIVDAQGVSVSGSASVAIADRETGP